MSLNAKPSREGSTVQAGATAFDRDDVEAGVGAGRGDLQPVGGQAAQRRAFARVDGGQRRAEAPGTPGLHFDENDRTALPGDDVDLAAGQTDVARDHLVPETLEESNRSVFTFMSGECFPLHGKKPGSSCAASRTRQNPRRCATHGP